MLEKILLNHEYGEYDLIKRFGFDSDKEDLIGFNMKEDLVQDLLYKEDLLEESYFGCSGATCGTRYFSIWVATSGFCQQTNVVTFS